MERLSISLIRIRSLLINLQLSVAVKYLRLCVTEVTKVSAYSDTVRGSLTT